MLVVLMIATPSLLLPWSSSDATQMVMLVAIFGAALTIFEYSSTYPGLVEFREAPPFNRIRFVSLFATVFLLTVLTRGQVEPTAATDFVTAVGRLVAGAMDFPYSPVRLVVLMLPDGTGAARIDLVRTGAGMSYLVSLLTLAVFVFVLYVRRWPTRRGAFNVWINLPTFDPTAVGDVVQRLERDARVNLGLGFLLPFLTPAVVEGASALFGTVSLASPLHVHLDGDGMGLSSRLAVHAGHRDGPDRRHDRGQAPARRRPRRRRGHRPGAHHLIAALALALLPALVPRAQAQPLTIATYDTELSRDGPGLLLADLARATPDAGAAAAVVAGTDADAILLTGIDYDAEGRALDAFNRLIGGGAPAYPHGFALRPNSGMASGLDLDGDGRRGGPGDAQGWGRFAGQNGMAILSRLPIDRAAAVDLSGLLWRDLPGARLPRRPDGGPFPSAAAQAVQRLSTTGHWDVPLILPDGRRLHLLAFAATPPVFDGPEDRNGRRALDELTLWRAYLSGTLAQPPPEGPFVILGLANLDPARGDGDRAAMADFLADPRWQDPRPADDSGETATGFFTPPAGALRVDYVLPSAGLHILAATLGARPARARPARTSSAKDDRPGSRHRPVSVTLALP